MFYMSISRLMAKIYVDINFFKTLSKNEVMYQFFINFFFAIVVKINGFS